MSDADSAYGLFLANRDSSLPIAAIGMGGQVQPQSASFAKGKYYVEMTVIAAHPDSDRTPALKLFVTAIEQRLEGRVTAPEASQWFPKENLASIRMVPESVLGLRLLKRGYVATYKQGQAFVVLEDSPASAAEVMKKLREHFDGASPGADWRRSIPGQGTVPGRNLYLSQGSNPGRLREPARSPASCFPGRSTRSAHSIRVAHRRNRIVEARNYSQ